MGSSNSSSTSNNDSDHRSRRRVMRRGYRASVRGLNSSPSTSGNPFNISSPPISVSIPLDFSTTSSNSNNNNNNSDSNNNDTTNNDASNNSESDEYGINTSMALISFLQRWHDSYVGSRGWISIGRGSERNNDRENGDNENE